MSSSSPTVQQISWSLTKRRIGFRFLGLDAAGNVLLYPSYRGSNSPGTTTSRSWRFGSWNTVTFAFGSNLDRGELFLEQGHPMHQSAVIRLEGLLRERRRAFVARQELARQKIAQRTAAMETQQKQSSERGGGAAEPISVDEEEPIVLQDEADFTKEIAQELSQPSFLRAHLRVHSLLGFRGVYHVLYGGCWLAVLAALWNVYRLCKSWMSPPVQDSLSNLEYKLSYYPRQAVWLLGEASQSEPWIRTSEVLEDASKQTKKVLVEKVLGSGSRREEEEAQAQKRLQEEEAAKSKARRWELLERLAASLLLALFVVCFGLDAQ